MIDSATIEESQEIARSREDLYGFLAGVFGHPPSLVLVELVQGGLLEELAPLGEGEGLDLLRRFATRHDAPSELARALEVEYTGLFVLPASGKAQPFESVYLDPEQRLGGPATVAVERAYARAGARPSAGRIHVADHLSVELEFMAFLCGREREAWEVSERALARRCLTLEREFLDTHLSRWVGPFAADVKERASTELYPAMAWVAERVVRLDLDNVRALLEEIPPGDE
jgi:TorA maturation chaperone TorD